MRSMVFRCEQLRESQPPKEFQVTIVLDRNGTTMKNQDSDMMKTFFALFAEKYPNKLNKVRDDGEHLRPASDEPLMRDCLCLQCCRCWCTRRTWCSGRCGQG
jgi:hypothetical protein